VPGQIGDYLAAQIDVARIAINATIAKRHGKSTSSVQ
jgi:hypothetical protein